LKAPIAKRPSIAVKGLGLRQMGGRMLKAARFDAKTFMDLRDDEGATAQSLFLIGLVALCYGAGLGLYGYLTGGLTLTDLASFSGFGVIIGSAVALVWTGISFFIVTRLYHRTIDYWGLARPFFFSWSPGLVFVLISAPVLWVSEIFRAIGIIWIAVGSVSAVKHAVGITSQQSMLAFMTSVLSLVLIGTFAISIIQSIFA
jgi:Yip1 domain